MHVHEVLYAELQHFNELHHCVVAEKVQISLADLRKGHVSHDALKHLYVDGVDNVGEVDARERPKINRPETLLERETALLG